MRRQKFSDAARAIADTIKGLRLAEILDNRRAFHYNFSANFRKYFEKMKRKKKIARKFWRFEKAMRSTRVVIFYSIVITRRRLPRAFLAMTADLSNYIISSNTSNDVYRSTLTGGTLTQSAIYEFVKYSNYRIGEM